MAFGPYLVERLGVVQHVRYVRYARSQRDSPYPALPDEGGVA